MHYFDVNHHYIALKRVILMQNITELHYFAVNQNSIALKCIIVL